MHNNALLRQRLIWIISQYFVVCIFGPHSKRSRRQSRSDGSSTDGERQNSVIGTVLFREILHFSMG